MQETNIDAIKFSASLLNQLKKKGLIDIHNKLTHAGISTLTDQNLRLLIQLQAVSQQYNNTSRLQEIRAKVSSKCQGVQQNSEEKIINKMLIMKTNALMLSKAISQKDLSLCLSLTQQILKVVTNLQDLTYLLQIMFQVKSLYFLEVLNYRKTDISHFSIEQQEVFFYMLALIKINNRKEQALEILVNELKGKQMIEHIQKENLALISVLKLLIDFEKQLRRISKPVILEEQNSRFLFYESTRKIIKNKFFLEFRIDLDLSFQQCEEQLASLDQKSYLLALPLFHFYFENNQKVTRKLVLTQINRKISIAKSVLVETLPINSTNGKNKSKFKFRYPRNAQAYSRFIQQTSEKNKKCTQICQLGETFLKYNFNNLYSASKFVILTQERLMWAKSNSEIQKKSTKNKMRDIVGLLYGKVSARLQQSTVQGLCFSFLLKDRTADFSIEKQKRDTIHRFLLGANYYITNYHTEQKQKISKQIETRSNYSEVEESKYKITYHHMKCSQLTLGKLLWRDLFLSLSKRTKRYESEVFPKSKYIIYFANKQSMNNSKLSQKKSQL